MNTKNLKFRVWVHAEKKMRPVFELNYMVDRGIAVQCCSQNVKEEYRLRYKVPSEAVLLLYSDYTDGNGQEICESDIVEIDGEEFQVVFDQYSYGLMFRDEDGSEIDIENTLNEAGYVRVIGNMYEGVDPRNGLKEVSDAEKLRLEISKLERRVEKLERKENT